MIRILPSKLNGKIEAPASKSQAQRYLFMAGLSTYPSIIHNVPVSDDINTTIMCLTDLGCRIQVKSDNVVAVSPIPKNIPVPKADLDFRDSATCCKLAVAIGAACGYQLNCSGTETLRKRRLNNLTSRMAIRGVKFTNFSLPFSLSGRLEAGEFIMEGSEGDQNISALLMALPILRDDSTIRLDGESCDQELIDMTIRAMEDFDVHVEKTPTGYYIPGKQMYETQGEMSVESDWALSCMWLLAGAASGNPEGGVTIAGLTNRPPQSYKDLQPLLSVICQDFQYIEFNAKNSPNLATVVAAMAIVKGTGVKITGVSHLRYKESDRLKLIAKIARKMGQSAEVTDDGIIIEGCGHPNYDEDVFIDCEKDPWIFMSMVLASTVAEKSFCLEGEGGADKVYMDFLPDFVRLGGNYEQLSEKENQPEEPIPAAD